jgi:hypothetical protein
MSWDSVHQTVAQFTASHRDLLEHLTNRLDSIISPQSDFQALSDESQMASARQNILNSFHFPQIRERREHVLKAHNETYQWILEAEQAGRWPDFISWLRDPSSKNRIYRVHGKIGAGKTTLLRFLDDNLKLHDHMLPWASNTAVLRASYFFWNAGNQLQKSTNGFLRTLLRQLFELTPELIPQLYTQESSRLPALLATII